MTGSEAPALDDEGLRFAARIHRSERERALIALIVQSFLRTNPFRAEERDELIPDPDAAKVLGRVGSPVPATIYLISH